MHAGLGEIVTMLLPLLVLAVIVVAPAVVWLAVFRKAPGRVPSRIAITPQERTLRQAVVGCGCLVPTVGVALFLCIWQFLAPAERPRAPSATTTGAPR